MIVESANPVHSLADSQRMREALDALELVVVIDVAMTETGAARATTCCRRRRSSRSGRRRSSRSSSRENVFQLRAPLLRRRSRARCPSPRSTAAWCARSARSPTTIWRRCARPRRRGAPRSRRRSSQVTIGAPRARRARAGRPLRDARPDAAAPATRRRPLLWGAAHTCAMSYPESVRRAGFDGDGPALGEALFEAILTRRSGVTFTVDEYEETWRRLATPDGKINLDDPGAARASSRRCRDEPPAARRDVPVRALGRRAPLVDGEHDLPRSRRGGRRTRPARCA